MFGYVAANLADLSQVEQDRYRAAYCGLCSALKECHGQLSRFSLTYDMAFLVLLLGSLYEPAERAGTERCPAHPVKPHAYLRTRFTDYAADLSVALAYHKCLDDWNDDRSLRGRAYASSLKTHYDQVKQRLPRQCGEIEAALADIAAVEQAALAANTQGARAVSAQGEQVADARDEAKRPAAEEEAVSALPNPVNGEAAAASTLSGPANDWRPAPDLHVPARRTPPSTDASPGPDAGANRFGRLMGELFVVEEDLWAPTLREFGAQLGRFIYFMDAACDLPHDRQTGSYNPLMELELEDDDITVALATFAGRATAQFEKLPLEQDLHLLRSVLYSGIWQKRNAQQQKEAKRQARRGHGGQRSLEPESAADAAQPRKHDPHNPHEKDA